jgi:hypothetical protein
VVLGFVYPLDVGYLLGGEGEDDGSVLRGGPVPEENPGAGEFEGEVGVLDEHVAAAVLDVVDEVGRHGVT